MKRYVGILFILFNLNLQAKFIELKQEFYLSTQYQTHDRSVSLNFNYKPQISLVFHEKDEFAFDAELVPVVNVKYYSDENDKEITLDTDLYRSWLRFSTEYTQFRIGLQKINFGTAKFLRPLQWFDTIDPNDKLIRSEGVYAALFKYYFQGNQNFWLWCILPENEINTWFPLESERNKPQFGSRLQLPISTADLGLTFHWRKFTIPDQFSLFVDNDDLQEFRYAFDLEFYWIYGFWFEGAVFTHEDIFFDHEIMITAGLDYTIPQGNGIYTAFEHFYYYLDDEQDLMSFIHYSNELNFSAIHLSYSLNIFDSFSVQCFYDHDNEDVNSTISYQKSYDRLSYYLKLSYSSSSMTFDNLNKESEQNYSIEFIAKLDI